MPVTSSPASHSSKDEIKRNLILRLRYGPLSQSHRGYDEEESLRVEGQAVSKMGDRVAFHLPGSPLEELFPSQSDGPPDGQRQSTSQKSRSRPMGVKGVGYRRIKNPSASRPKVKPRIIDITEDDELGAGVSSCCFETGRIPPNSAVTSMTACAGDIGDSCQNLMTSFNRKQLESAGEVVDGASKTKLSRLKSEIESFDANETSSLTPPPRTDGDKESSKQTARKKGRRASAAKKFNALHVTPNVASGRSYKIGSSKKRMTRPEAKKSCDINSRGDTVEDSSSNEDLKEKIPPFIKTFYQMPESKPKNVCFDYPGIDITYMNVKEAIEKVIPDAFENDKVISLQFENVNIKFGTSNVNNRWHVKLADFATRNKLIKSGLDLKPKSKSREKPISQFENPFPAYSCKSLRKPRVEVKLYDSVIMEEYKTFLKKNAADEKLQKAILMCAGSGNNLLTTML